MIYHMPLIQLHLSKSQNTKVIIYKMEHRLQTKSEAIRQILDKYKTKTEIKIKRFESKISKLESQENK